MLSFFPEMYPDEILYSVLSRYHQYSGNRKVKLSYSELLGCNGLNSFNPVVLPRNLAYLSMQVQEYGVSYDELLYKRTLFPYLYLFITDERLKKAEAKAFSLSTVDVSLKTAEEDYLVTNIEYLKYCPLCLEEEYEIYGEAYWHRHHQIPGVLVCTKHRVVLQNSLITPYKYLLGLHSLEKTSISSIQNTISLNSDDMKVALQLASEIQWIIDNFDLVHKLWGKNIHHFQDVYFYLLAKKGFVTKHRVVLNTQFTRDFHRYYGKILSIFDSAFADKHSYSCSLKVFLCESGEMEPIRHFLMMKYLSGSIQEFFIKLEKYKPEISYSVPIYSYYSSAESNHFIKDREKFRETWFMYSLYFYHTCVKKINHKAFSALSWIYIYDKEWFSHDRIPYNNVKDKQILATEKIILRDISRKHSRSFSFSKRLICRFKHKTIIQQNTTLNGIFSCYYKKQ